MLIKKKIYFTRLYKLVNDKNELHKKINATIKKGQFIGGKIINDFEDKFSRYVGSKYCITVGNGTDALEIAIKSLKIPKNSEVIVPVNTWISTAEAVLTNNLKVKFCDINLTDYSMCTKDLARKINKKTKLIIPVHLYGNATNMNVIKKIAEKNKLKIIEDCAQAHGTLCDGRHVGTFGQLGTFSFFPGKNLGGFGDGGCIVTNNKILADFCKRTRSHGAMNKYDHVFSGRNSRLDVLNALVLNHKLKFYNQVVKKRKLLANIYFKNLSNEPKIKLFELNKKNQSSFHQFVIRTEHRDSLRNFLKDKGVETMIHYPKMLNEFYFFDNLNINLKNAKLLGKKILSLPISEEHSEKEIVYVCNTIKKFFNLQSSKH